MSTRDHIGLNRTVGEQDEERFEADVEVIDEAAVRERNLRPSVEQAVQATVDYADDRALNGRRFGQTLAAQERMEARELEIERTRVRWDRRQDSDREARCRDTVAGMARAQRIEFVERAASVDKWLDPDRADARESLRREDLGAVNRAAVRAAERVAGCSRTLVARRMAERVVDGADVPSAALAVVAEEQLAPGRITPIEYVGTVERREVDIEGRVSVLWEPSHPKIQQVGLLEDETGRIKFTAWKASEVPMVREGERIRFRDVAKSWYEGRVSVALTGRSRVVFPDR